MDSYERAFLKGYACACAVLARAHDLPTTAVDVLRSSGYDKRDLLNADVDRYDVDAIFSPKDTSARREGDEMRTVEQEWDAFKCELRPGDERDIRRIFFCGFLGGVSAAADPGLSALQLATLHDQLISVLQYKAEPLAPLVEATRNGDSEDA